MKRAVPDRRERALRTFVLASLAALAWTAAAQPAQAFDASPSPPSSQPSSTLPSPPPELIRTGALIAARGVPATGIAACATCHGPAGEGNSAAGFPRLAGQPASYLQRQLEHFASGLRRNPVMEPIAKSLTAQQQRGLAVYFAALATPASPPGPGELAANERVDVARGRVLATVGDRRLGVQACANCHGPEGRGLPPGTPYLAGQPASYLVSALGEWADGSRRTDASGHMPRIARALDEGDVRALAAWFAGLAPPPPSQAWPRTPLRAAHRTLMPSGPAAEEGSSDSAR